MTFPTRSSSGETVDRALLGRLHAGTIAALLAFWAWMIFMSLRGSLRWDHVAIALFATALAWGPPAAKRLFHGILPLGFVGLLYDAMRFVEHVGLSESTVHVCDLRALEIRWFGVTAEGRRMTLHDWLQPRASLALDVLFAVPYGAFLLLVFGYCVYLFVRNFAVAQRFAWAFLGVNVAGFVTYHVYPAAPPWYFHRFGCIVDLSAAASAGPNLMRVDALLGVPYFAGLYGRASDVFGAFPSLHVAYPTLMLAVGYRMHRFVGRALLILFVVWMSAAAVYLDHHWVVDIVGGVAYGLAGAYAAQRVSQHRAAAQKAPSPAALGAETGRAPG